MHAVDLSATLLAVRHPHPHPYLGPRTRPPLHPHLPLTLALTLTLTCPLTLALTLTQASGATPTSKLIDGIDHTNAIFGTAEGLSDPYPACALTEPSLSTPASS